MWTAISSNTCFPQHSHRVLAVNSILVQWCGHYGDVLGTGVGAVAGAETGWPMKTMETALQLAQQPSPCEVPDTPTSLLILFKPQSPSRKD